MKLGEISIQNFKGIANSTYKFNPQFTVLIGNNGAGKSSILDAISIAMATILMKTQASFGINGRKSRPLLKNEIRKIMVSPENIEYTNVELSGQFIINEEEYKWRRNQSMTSKSLSYTDARNLINIGKDLINNIHTEINFPVMVYHSTARLAGETSNKKTAYEKTGSRLDGYHACLDPRSIKQKFISWFKTFEDLALKFNKDKSLYHAYTNTLSSVVPEWQDIKFHWGLDDIVGLQKNGEWLPLSDLSDGYRSVIRLVSDIAYRAIKLNPHLGINAVKESNGIVLIDEIDLHLHPKWQQRIVRDLKTTFPNIQFIVTTHSPFIVQSLKSNELINLNEKQLDQHPHSMSIEQNALFMGVESRNSLLFHTKESATKEYLKILDNDFLDEENERKLDELIQISSDPVFVAKLKLERLAKHGKK